MRYVEKIDLYGLKAELRTFGKDRFKTWLGGILTILTVLMVGATSFLFGQDFWFKTNPKVVSGKIVPDKSELIYPTSSNFTVVFRLEDDFGNKQEDKDKILVPHFTYCHYKRNSKKEWTTEMLIESSGTKCSQTLAKDNSKISNLDLEQFNCIDWEEIARRGQENGKEGYKPVIGGTWEEDEIGYFYIAVSNFHVNNEGERVFNKYSEIKDFIEGSEKYLSVFYPESLFDASNLEEPLNKYWRNYFYKISHTMAGTDRFFFSLVKLENDLGWIFKNIDNSFATTKSNHDIEMNIVDQNSDSESHVHLYIFLFYLERSQQEIQRSYMKIQELGAMLGGFVKAVQILFSFMASNYSKYKRNIFVHDKLNKNLPINKTLDMSKSGVTTNNFLNKKIAKGKKELNVSFLQILFNFCLKADKNIEQFKLFESSVKEKIDIQTLFSLSDRLALLEKRINS